ncbi:hypothetical protein E4U61_005813 [Claviceps capensis]|nr:hypothetical protein E4U61_005813 [Claviceps capensis]
MCPVQSTNLEDEKESSTETPDSTTVHAIEEPPIEVGRHTDDELDLSSIEGDNDTARLTSSISSSRIHEGGRRYLVFDDGRYPIPNDEIKQSREDMKHAMLMIERRGLS